MSEHAAQPAVRIEALRAGYRRHPVLHGVSARLPRARVTAVLGPNGSGKSTLLAVIAGILPVVAGDVRFAEHGRPALVVQRSAASDALPLTAREVVAMGRWAKRPPWRRLTKHDWSVVSECMERLEVGDLAKHQLGALSGGQRQRVLVAQGLAQQAALLLLDEPAAGVDVAAERLIAAALREVADSGSTVVQVTHSAAEARTADHCLLLDGGRVAGEGPPREVLTPETIASAWKPGRQG